MACLAAQTSCAMEDPTQSFGIGSFGAPDQGTSVDDIVAFANAGNPT